MRNADLQAELDVRDNRTRLAEIAGDKMAAALAMLWHTTPAKNHPVIDAGFEAGRRWQAKRKKEIRPTNNQVKIGPRSKADA